MSDGKVLLKDNVRDEWIDYNGHMNDSGYGRVFSMGVDAFMDAIGVNEAFRSEEAYTVFTLETHICYLDEMNQGESLEVRLYMLDYDAKRAHVFFELYGKDGKRAATSEQMLMGMDQNEGRPAPFPESVWDHLEGLANAHTPAEKPNEAGRVIGIKRKK